MSIVSQVPRYQVRRIQPLEYYMLTFLVKKDIGGKIVGRNGTTVKEICYETNTNIDVENYNSYEKLVAIRGKFEYCTNACTTILKRFFNNKNENEPIPLHLITNDVLIGCLIENHGNLLRDIMHRTQTAIVVSQHENIGNHRNVNRIIVITGFMLENISFAVDLVSQALKTSLEKYVADFMPSLPSYAYINPLLLPVRVSHNAESFNENSMDSLAPCQALVPGTETVYPSEVPNEQNNSFLNSDASNQSVVPALYDTCEIMLKDQNENIPATISCEVIHGTTYFLSQSYQQMNNFYKTYNIEPNRQYGCLIKHTVQYDSTYINGQYNGIPYAENILVNDESKNSNNTKSENPITDHSSNTDININNKERESMTNINFEDPYVTEVTIAEEGTSNNQTENNIDGMVSSENYSDSEIRIISTELKSLALENKGISKHIKFYDELFSDHKICEDDKKSNIEMNVENSVGVNNIHFNSNFTLKPESNWIRNDCAVENESNLDEHGQELGVENLTETNNEISKEIFIKPLITESQNNCSCCYYYSKDNNAAEITEKQDNYSQVNNMPKNMIIYDDDESVANYEENIYNENSGEEYLSQSTQTDTRIFIQLKNTKSTQTVFHEINLPQIIDIAKSELPEKYDTSVSMSMDQPKNNAVTQTNKGQIYNPGRKWWCSLREQYLHLLQSVNQDYIQPYCYLCGDNLKEVEHCLVHIPKAAIGAIIGIHGFHIRTVMTIADAFITVLKNKRVRNGECQVEIIANYESQWKAQYLIYYKLIMERFSLSPHSNVFTISMLISTKYAGKIIGSHGSTIMEIEKISNCTIKLTSLNERISCEEVTCLISGGFYGVMAAQRLIRSKIHEHKGNYNNNIMNSNYCSGVDCKKYSDLPNIDEIAKNTSTEVTESNGTILKEALESINN